MRILVCMLLVFVWQNIACSDSNLERIRAAVEDETQSLNAINKRLKELSGAVEDVRAQITQFKKREANLGGELKAITEEKEQLDTEILASDNRIENIKEVLQERIRSLYMNRDTSLADQLRLAARQPEFVRTAYYLKHVRQFDNSIIEELREEQAVNRKKKKDLEQLIENQDLIRDLLVAQRKKVEQELVRQRKLERGLEAEKKRLEPVLTSLRAQALRLETVMLSYANSSITRQSASKQVAPSVDKDPLPDFKGKGLAHLKGRLGLPINRKLLRGFGKYKISGFKDMVKSKGIEFVAGPKEHVRAVAPGQVMFVGSLPGYEQVAIVNHGQRYYSLYGQLGRILVDKGQILAKGQAVGVSEDGGTVYLEIRHKGKPLNPTVFYKLPKS